MLAQIVHTIVRVLCLFSRSFSCFCLHVKRVFRFRSITRAVNQMHAGVLETGMHVCMCSCMLLHSNSIDSTQ